MVTEFQRRASLAYAYWREYQLPGWCSGGELPLVWIRTMGDHPHDPDAGTCVYRHHYQIGSGRLAVLP